MTRIKYKGAVYERVDATDAKEVAVKLNVRGAAVMFGGKQISDLASEITNEVHSNPTLAKQRLALIKNHLKIAKEKIAESAMLTKELEKLLG